MTAAKRLRAAYLIAYVAIAAALMQPSAFASVADRGDRDPGHPTPETAADGINLHAISTNTFDKIDQLLAAAGHHQGRGRTSGAEAARRKAELERCLANAARLASAGGIASDPCTGSGYARPRQETAATRPSQDQVTGAVVLSETKHLPFPAFRVQIEPARKTLVNLDTNVYTISAPLVRTVTVLTWPVKIRATPTSYTWHFGDGTTEITTTPGAPRPAALVTHKYVDRHAEDGGVKVSVTVTYDAWYKLDGQPWRLAGQVPIAGPGTPLLVCEARPILTDPDNPNPYTPAPDLANPCRR